MATDIHFVTDAEGHKTAVFLPPSRYEAFRQFMEDQGLGRAALDALADEERIPWEQVKADLIAQGKMDA